MNALGGPLTRSEVRSSLFLAVATKVTRVSGPDMARFGAIVNRRRRELGLSLDDVAAVGGPSQVTVSNIEQGATNKPHFATFAKLDTALSWTPGSAARTFDGQSPEPLDLTDQTQASSRRRTASAIGPDDAAVSMQTVGDLLVVAQKIERIAANSASADLKQASAELETLVDRVMRTWIITQVETRLIEDGGERQQDPMIEIFLSDYLLRASRPGTDADEFDLGYLQWLLDKSDDLTPEQTSAFEDRWNSKRME